MRLSVRSRLIALSVLPLFGCVTNVADAPKVPVTGPVPLTAEVPAGSLIFLDLPNGEVSIVADEVEYAEAHLSAKCPADSSKCRKRIAKLSWTERRDGNRITLGLDGSPTLNSEIVVNIRIPQRHALDVRMKYGSLSIENAQHAVAVNMKAGDVGISMPYAAVKSAFLRARFGDASLSIPESAISGRRPTLVGATVDWPHGRGRYPVSAKLRYGDVRLRLLD